MVAIVFLLVPTLVAYYIWLFVTLGMEYLDNPFQTKRDFWISIIPFGYIIRHLFRQYQKLA